jgi:hypothetical protein
MISPHFKSRVTPSRGFVQGHPSHLSATMGSIFIARLAGQYAARTPRPASPQRLQRGCADRGARTGKARCRQTERHPFPGVPLATSSSIFFRRRSRISSERSLWRRRRENSCPSQFTIHPALRHAYCLHSQTVAALQRQLVPRASRPQPTPRPFLGDVPESLLRAQRTAGEVKKIA